MKHMWAANCADSTDRPTKWSDADLLKRCGAGFSPSQGNGWACRMWPIPSQPEFASVAEFKLTPIEHYS